MRWKNIEIFIILLLVSSCNNFNSKSDDNILMAYKDHNNIQYRCEYLFEQNILNKIHCITEDDSIGYIIYYYANGLAKSFEPLNGNNIHGQKMDYYENGSIYASTQYNYGKASGEIKIYYPNGNLKAFNLVHKDSIYYARFYSDSIFQGKFIEEIIPIVYLENDSIPVNDTVNIKIQFPLIGKLGIDTGKYILRYDKLPARLLEGKNPYASYAMEITDEDIWIGVGAGIESHDKFYCYITDKQGNIVGPTVYRDLYFVK